MKSFLFFLMTAFFLVLSVKVGAQNVSINNDGSPADPAAILDIRSGTKGVLIPRMLQSFRMAINPAPQGLMVYQIDGASGLYYNASALPAIQNWYKLINPVDQNWLTTLSGNHIYNANTANVGIGNSSPVDAGLVVDTKVGAVNAMFGRNTTGVAIESSNPGIGLNSYFNVVRRSIGVGYTGLVGLNPANGDLTLSNSSVSTIVDQFAIVTPRLTINNAGNIGVEGNTSPLVPLSFANTVGNKISLWGSSTTSNYGLGIQGALLQMYTNSNVADIAFGYGSSTSFTENMRIKGTGLVGIGVTNPTTALTVAATGMGIMQQSTDATTQVGFYTSSGDAFIQTNTNHPLYFATNNSSAQMTLSTGGLLGIGNFTPADAGLVVDKKVGAVNAMFGRNTTGVAIESSYPGVGLNSYYNGGRKTISTGYTGLLSLNPTNGDLTLYNSTTSTATDAASTITDRLTIANDGRISIGTTQKATGYIVNIGGKIIAEEVRVQLRASWPDYIFEKDHKLLPLTDLEKFINQNKHLPGIPASQEVEKNGLDLGDMQKKMMEKIEQLTLYVIDLQQQISSLKSKINETK